MVEVVAEIVGEEPPLELANRSAREVAAEMKQRNVDRLKELEGAIERGLDAFMEVGSALIEIREFKLYLVAGFKNFPDYTRSRWGLTNTGAQNKIQATRVIETLSNVDDGVTVMLPVNETQANALSRLLKTPEKLRATWTTVTQAVESPREIKPRELRIAVATAMGVEAPKFPMGRPPRRVECPECHHQFEAKAHEIMPGQGARTDKA